MQKSGVQAPVAYAHLEIYFSGLYVKRVWFIGIESGLGPVGPGFSAFEFNRVTPEKIIYVHMCSS